MVKAVKTLGRKSIGVAADVSDSDATDKMVEDVVSKLGRLDVCIANAGIAHIAPILETTPADRRNMVNVNCEGLMNTYISAAKQMKKQGHSDTYRIIGAASIVSYNTFAMLGSYSASKHFVRGFTQVRCSTRHSPRKLRHVSSALTHMFDLLSGAGCRQRMGAVRDTCVRLRSRYRRHVNVGED